MKYTVLWNKTTRELRVAAADATAAGFTKLGDINHPDATDTLGPQVSHVLYQHVEDLLYKSGEEDMQRLKLTWPGKVVAQFISTDPSKEQKILGKPGATKQIIIFTFPEEISDRRGIYKSTNEKVAKVSSTGLVTLIGTGKCDIIVNLLNDSVVDYIIPVEVTV